MRDQLKRDGTIIDSHTGMHEISVTKDGLIHLCAAMEREDLVEWNGHVLKFDDGEGPFFDDLTKQELPASLVKAARKKKLEYFESKGFGERCQSRRLGRYPAAHRLRFGGPMSIKKTINILT